MEHKHTPGPWVICREDDDIFGGYRIFAESQLGTAFVERLGWDALVAEAGLDHPNYEANARLIAAAPELLKCLIELEEAARQVQAKEMDRHSIDVERRNARAAIAKATGAIHE